MSRSKKWDGYLVYDWKKNDARLRKSKPNKSELGTNEICISTDIEVNIPEISVPDISLQVDVPEVEVRRAVADVMELEADDETGLPDPEDTIYSCDSASELEDSVDAVIDEYVDDDYTTVVGWLRKMLACEASNFDRPEFMDVIEDKLFEYRQKRRDD